MKESSRRISKIHLYVDDLLYTGSSVEMLVEFTIAMFNEF